MLQEDKRDVACMYVHTSFDTYSDRHVLGLLLCAGVICAVPCCALLCSQFNDSILIHTPAVLILLYTGTT